MTNLENDIGRVIENYYHELEKRAYAKSTIAHYHTHVEKFKMWCIDNGIKHFSESVAMSYCKSKIGSYVFTSNLSHNQKDALRAIRMVVGLEKEGRFEVRGPQREYRFVHLDSLVTEHLVRYIDKKHPSLNSLQNRKRILQQFDEFLSSKSIELQNISSDLLNEFFSNKTSYQRKNSKINIREFLRDLYDAGVIGDDLSSLIMKEPHVSKHIQLPTTYTDDEIKRILATIDRSSSNGKRNYLAVLLAAVYGLRASDIINLRFSNIDWENNKIDIIQEKTHNHIQLPLLGSVGNAIIDYLKNGRPSTDCDIILVRHDNQFKGKPVSNTLIYNVVSEAIANAEINDWRSKKHGPHSLRHSLASNLLKKGTTLSIISNVLGHQSTETTKIYVSVDIEKLRLCSLQIPPLTSNHFKNRNRHGNDI